MCQCTKRRNLALTEPCNVNTGRQRESVKSDKEAKVGLRARQILYSRSQAMAEIHEGTQISNAVYQRVFHCTEKRNSLLSSTRYSSKELLACQSDWTRYKREMNLEIAKESCINEFLCERKRNACQFELACQ